MKFRNNIWVIGIFGIMACGNSNQIQVSAPGVVSASVKVSSLATSNVLSQKEMTFEQVDFSGSDIGLESVEIDISNGMKAVVNNGAQFEQINVNALTTLAACRFKKPDVISISELVTAQNKLIAKQFLIADLQLIQPNLDLAHIQELNLSSMYGILIKGFERLAKNQNMAVGKMLEVLCADIEFDGLLNSFDKEGSIQSRFGWYDDQLLKSRYADAIYFYALEEIKTFDQLPIAAFVNEISLSAEPGIYSSSTVNYSFDQ